MATQSIAPTASQQASAALHLERQADWRFYRVGGVRYVALPSANSGKTYAVRADAAGCSCVFYERTGRACAHMIAVWQAQPAPTALDRLDALYPPCAGGCGDLVERKGERCYPCTSAETHRLEQDRKADYLETRRLHDLARHRG